MTFASQYLLDYFSIIVMHHGKATGDINCRAPKSNVSLCIQIVLRQLKIWSWSFLDSLYAYCIHYDVVKTHFESEATNKISFISSLFIPKACREGLYEEVTRLLEDNPLINSLDDSGFAPLHYAARYQRTHIVSLLIDHGAGEHAQYTSLSFTI